MTTIMGIPVTITQEDGKYLITDTVVNMYGEGMTVNAASHDYRCAVTAYYNELLSDEGNLGSSLRDHLGYLRVMGVCDDS